MLLFSILSSFGHYITNIESITILNINNSQFEMLMTKIRNRIALEDFSMLSLIGKGTFAKVALVKNLQSGIHYAMKIIKKRQVLKKNQQEYVLLQKKILTQVNHPFIITMAGCFQSPEKLYFVLEYCPGGDLYGLITKRHRFTEQQTRFYAGQIILALQHLHNRNFVYRDLKPQNVLLDKDGYIKLTDFGLSNICQGSHDSTGMVGTPQYLAPQILNKLPYGKSVDCWCLGSIIYEMITGIPPFFAANEHDTFEKIKNSNFNMPPKASTRLRSLLEGLLHKQPSERLGYSSIDQVKNHPWFSKINWQSLLKRQQKAPFVPMIQQECDISNFDCQFTECQIGSWQDKKSVGQEEWNLSDFSYQNQENLEGDNLFSEESWSSGSFEMKGVQEETLNIQ